MFAQRWTEPCSYQRVLAWGPWQQCAWRSDWCLTQAVGSRRWGFMLLEVWEGFWETLVWCAWYAFSVLGTMCAALRAGRVALST